MTYQILLSATKSRFSSPNSSLPYVISQASNKDSPPSFTHKQTVRTKNKLTLGRSICKLRSTRIKGTGSDSYLWPNLLLTTQKTQVQAIQFSSLTAGFTLEFSTKKTLISAPNQNL